VFFYLRSDTNAATTSSSGDEDAIATPIPDFPFSSAGNSDLITPPPDAPNRNDRKRGGECGHVGSCTANKYCLKGDPLGRLCWILGNAGVFAGIGPNVGEHDNKQEYVVSAIAATRSWMFSSVETWLNKRFVCLRSSIPPFPTNLPRNVGLLLFDHTTAARVVNEHLMAIPKEMSDSPAFTRACSQIPCFCLLHGFVVNGAGDENPNAPLRLPEDPEAVSNDDLINIHGVRKLCPYPLANALLMFIRNGLESALHFCNVMIEKLCTNSSLRTHANAQKAALMTWTATKKEMICCLQQYSAMQQTLSRHSPEDASGPIAYSALFELLNKVSTMDGAMNVASTELARKVFLQCHCITTFTHFGAFPSMHLSLKAQGKANLGLESKAAAMVSLDSLTDSDLYAMDIMAMQNMHFKGGVATRDRFMLEKRTSIAMEKVLNVGDTHLGDASVNVKHLGPRFEAEGSKVSAETYYADLACARAEFHYELGDDVERAFSKHAIVTRYGDRIDPRTVQYNVHLYSLCHKYPIFGNLTGLTSPRWIVYSTKMEFASNEFPPEPTPETIAADAAKAAERKEKRDQQKQDQEKMSDHEHALFLSELAKVALYFSSWV
jgi:hypothetical protein